MALARDATGGESDVLRTVAEVVNRIRESVGGFDQIDNTGCSDSVAEIKKGATRDGPT